MDDAPQDETEQVEGEETEQVEEVEAEGEEDAPAVEQKFRVKVKNDTGADEERDLSLDELAQGYMQNADYTRKTQAAAQAERQRQEQFHQAVHHTAEQASAQVQALRQMVLAAAAPDLMGVNWQQLAVEDPARYIQLQAREQQLNQVLGQLEAEDGKLKQQRDAALAQQREQAMRHSLDYLSREIKGFNLEKEAPRLREMGTKYGFSKEELASIVDGRFVHLLHDAAKWREATGQKQTAMNKVAQAPKVIRPSAPQPKKSNQAALDRLKSTGRPSELVHFL